MRLGSFQLPNDASLSYAEYGTSTGKPVLLLLGGKHLFRGNGGVSLQTAHEGNRSCPPWLWRLRLLRYGLRSRLGPAAD